MAQRDTQGQAAGTVALSPRRARFLALAAAPATAVAALVGPGCRVCGCTRGQFGMTELLGAVSSRARALTGEACEVDALSWAMHTDDAALIGSYRRKGYIGHLRLVFDRSFPRRHPEWIDLLEREMGEDMYGSNVHAKVVLLRAGGLRLVITGSMNFNINNRFEHFEVQDDPELWRFWRAIIDDVCSKVQRGLRSVEGAQYHESFKGALRSPEVLAAAGAEDDVPGVEEEDPGEVDDLALLEGGEFSSVHDADTDLAALAAVEAAEVEP